MTVVNIYLYSHFMSYHSSLVITSVGGVKASMVAFQAVDPGSIPGRRMLFLLFSVFHSFNDNFSYIQSLKSIPWQPTKTTDAESFV